MQKIAADISACSSCDLFLNRCNPVVGSGSLTAKIMICGEAPGQEEDIQGLPFVGRSGKLLDVFLAKIGMRREDVYIANVCKCRPPNNATPSWDQMQACIHFLHQQIQLIKPKVIVALGATATKALLNNPNIAITKIRGTLLDITVGNYGCKLMPTFHPAYVLRKPTEEMKQIVTSDFAKVKSFTEQ